jgi:GT2 family glycosyltransferase
VSQSEGLVRVVAVVVTWNRRDLLAESLRSIAAQSYAPSQVVVVDNASDDGTAELLAREFGIDDRFDIVTAAQNTGGAGGFAIGLQRALTHDPDGVWLMDDDTVPEPSALAELVDARTSYVPGPPALVASKVVWTDGRDHPMNTPRPKPGVREEELTAARRIGCLPIRSASFVSILVDAEAVRDRGLPIADYFLWNDDFEFTTRIIRGSRALYCPRSVVMHKTRTFGSTDADPGERFFYEVRNKVWLFGRSRGLSPVEKAVYGGSTLRRWGRTVAASSDRRTLLHAARRGLLEGVRGGPRPTYAVVADALGVVPEPRASGTEKFSLLMSVWGGDDPVFLVDAFRSVVHDQTRPPDDVVLVQDGPVPAALAEAIASLVADSPVPTTLLPLDENVGLGTALDRGMAACAHDIVARMDADDIALPRRFEVQVPLVEGGIDLVGSSLLEFGADADDIVGKRMPPIDPDEISRYARFHQPFNHPTVVYRRQAVEAAGGYRHLSLMEDYLLFAKMIGQGCRVANVEDPLVLYRVGAGAYARRGGVALLKSEVRLQRRLYDMGFTNWWQFVRNVVVRGSYRLAPEWLRRPSYRLLVARKGKH